MTSRNSKEGHLELVQSQTRKEIHSPGVLTRIEEGSLASARRLLDHMFSATDDLFYELSKRASSNNEETLYFESMRDIRIKKEGVINTFLHKMEENFKDLLAGKARSFAKEASQEPVDESSLALVESDDLEVQLALNNMANRTRDAFKNELYELSVRMDHLLLQVNVDVDNNPLGPHQIATAFVEACLERLEIGIKTRLIVFKLFEKHVLKQLGHIYSDANQLLVEAGILPKVSKNVSKGASANKPQAPKTDFSDETLPDAEASYHDTATAPEKESITIDQSTLSVLMSALRQALQTGVSNTGTNNYYFYTTNPGPVMAAPDLASLLTKQQPKVSRQLNSGAPKNILPEIVSELLAKQNPSEPQALDQSDEDTINLVAMFFDKILEDENLPLEVQSLICRIQIPVLKIALHDKTFLTNSDHPARRLINTITSAGLEFDSSKPLERDPLYRKVIDVVQNINRLYKLDYSVFDEAQRELDEIINKEKRKSAIVEKRTNQSEEGKAKIKHARNFAQSALFEKMKEEKLPRAISDFLTNTWLQVLIITFIKEGRDGSGWVENEQLVTDLIWLCHTHEDERSIARAQRLKPEILSRIEQGLMVAIDNPETRYNKTQEIEEAINALLERENIEEIELFGLNERQRENLGRAKATQKNWDEMTALERQQQQYEELSSKHYVIAKDTMIGTWVEYQDEENSRVLHCKLSAKIDADTYIFVNRFGFKVMEKTRRQFAYDMQFKKAKLLDSSPLFDRIMGSIVSLVK